MNSWLCGSSEEKRKEKPLFSHPNLRLPRARPLFLTHDNIWLCPNHLPDNSSTYRSDRWTTTSYRQNQYIIPNFSGFIKCTPTQIVSVITGNGTPRLLYLFTVYLATLMPFLLYVQHSKVICMKKKNIMKNVNQRLHLFDQKHSFKKKKLILNSK